MNSERIAWTLVARLASCCKAVVFGKLCLFLIEATMAVGDVKKTPPLVIRRSVWNCGNLPPPFELVSAISDLGY